MKKRGEGFLTMMLHYLLSQAIVGRKEGREGKKGECRPHEGKEITGKREKKVVFNDMI